MTKRKMTINVRLGFDRARRKNTIRRAFKFHVARRRRRAQSKGKDFYS
jgi:hypothetical protein